MKIAITGGTGFVGRNIARALVADGHKVALIARGHDQTDPSIQQLAGISFFQIGLDEPAELALAFAGCDAVAHCAGINREIQGQTYQRVHIDGTRNVVEAARRAGVKKTALISFLRARPNCSSGYHESKFAAEEIVRGSGLDYTVFKCGVIYGKGDHMLDHLSHAFYTFPLFAFVGFKDKPIRPTAVEEVARVVRSVRRRWRALEANSRCAGPGGIDTSRCGQASCPRGAEKTDYVSDAALVSLPSRLVCRTAYDDATRISCASSDALGRAE